MRRAWLFLAALAASSCGGAPPTPARVAWEHPWAGPKNTFANAILDGGRAEWNAATKQPFDPRWQGTDATSDLRATTADVATALAPLGAAPTLIYAAVVATFSAKAAAVSPGDAVDDPEATHATVFFTARALVSPDDHVSWMEADPPDPAHPRPWAHLAAIEEPNPDRAKIGDVVSPFRDGFDALVTAASDSSCAVPIADRSDLDHLPYQIDPDARAIYAARADALRRELPRFCATVGKGEAPWELHVSYIEAGFKNGAAVATLRSRVSIIGGVPYLGPVEVVRVGSESS